MKDYIKFKINGGIGAVLCSNCDKIIMSGGRIPEYIWEALKSHRIDEIPPMFCCQECQEEYERKNNYE